MTKRTKAFHVSPSNPAVGEIQTEPERYMDMPYAPAIRVQGGDMLFISGATPSPLYHKHPHILSDHNHPNDIKDQVRRAMNTVQSILRHEGLDWTDVVKMTKYLTDMRDMDGMNEVLPEYLKNWRPASTTICVNQLSTPGAYSEMFSCAASPPGLFACSVTLCSPSARSM